MIVELTSINDTIGKMDVLLSEIATVHEEGEGDERFTIILLKSGAHILVKESRETVRKHWNAHLRAIRDGVNVEAIERLMSRVQKMGK